MYLTLISKIQLCRDQTNRIRNIIYHNLKEESICVLKCFLDLCYFQSGLLICMGLFLL